ncbi:ribosome maturation factor RimP [Lentilactobacillus otakiensis]|uniref:Ribosome maturation factor RimP n=1 Tax=Lentilactobacillus otakiensis DSM 19908 = JCM 15040 TaxID=1423780 RepID=S4NF84_9LACO|nr:ribosome maturation factor RimP [Lentilactobacillus otakiensis]KRL09096.1 ribosome maturation factor rimP [Lentilactobacillus otakiensis DSM 19908 = JCM 15040]MBZ3775711.1 ribosome maturation factor RimP [Lentilactobacillus otakiensis]MDV3518930.1 ribosome maturation factor RimP [Lentilactobacillus otakiensis]GAD15907.1 ribosome maturation factor rimP [Lentilactobacillus otakiensis DSM 19908 = JCM 15040]
MSNVVETVKQVVEPILENHSFYLFDVEFVKENKSWYLRVYIDKKGGITIDDCVLVSDELSEKLDAMDPDPIPQAYFLEVSSPGAERPLRNDEELKQAIGEYIHVSLYKNLNGNKTFEGTLKSLDDDVMVLQNSKWGKQDTLEIPRNLVAKSRLAIQF